MITTFDEFLALLPRDGWTLDKYSAVRRGGDDTSSFDKGCECPVTAVANAVEHEDFLLTEFYDAGARLGMPEVLIEGIVDVADNRRFNSRWNSEYRQRLLAHCGLSEPENA